VSKNHWIPGSATLSRAILDGLTFLKVVDPSFPDPVPDPYPDSASDPVPDRILPANKVK
jgi:hypothetical protein